MDLTYKNYQQALRSIRSRLRGPYLSQETTLLPGIPVIMTGALQRSSLGQPRFLRGERDSLASISFVSLTSSTFNSLYFSSSLSYFLIPIASITDEILPAYLRKGERSNLISHLEPGLYSLSVGLWSLLSIHILCWNWLDVGVRLSSAFHFLTSLYYFALGFPSVTLLFLSSSLVSLFSLFFSYLLHIDCTDSTYPAYLRNKEHSHFL